MSINKLQEEIKISTNVDNKDKTPFKIKNLSFYPISNFPHLKLLNSNFLQIKEELIEIIKKEVFLNKNDKIFQPWIEFDLYNESNPNGWDIAPLMISGKLIEANCLKAPVLSELIKIIPGLVSVSFSLLKPDTHIVAHQGYDEYSEKVLRYHLGLIIPKGDLGIRVEKEVRTWIEGDSFIFDDFLIHEAWNFTKEDRYVLICDFVDINDELSKVSDQRFLESVSKYVDLSN